MAMEIRDFNGFHPAESNADEPVSHVSYTSLPLRQVGREAFPTEAEWEKAACFDPNEGKVRVFPWGDGLAFSKAERFGK